MPYEDKIMVASGDSEHPGTEEVSFETIPPRGGGEGHTYDLEFNQTLDEVTLIEDGTDKTTLPLAATFVGTEAEWNALSAAEKANYRLVNFTEDGGIGDASNAIVAFTSSDVVDENANDWTSVTPITTGLNLKTLWERASMMFKNVRYLFKMFGTTDISGIGDGTLTGGIDALNSDLNEKYVDFIIPITSSPVTLNVNDYGLYTGILGKTGYEPMGVVGISLSGTGSGRICISSYNVNLQNDTVSVMLMNTSNINISFNITARVLFRKIV